jgi:hypothetical protein
MKVSTQKLQPIGALVVVAYFFVYYFFPMVGQFVFYDDIFSIYTRDRFNPFALLFLTLVMIFFLISYSYMVTRRKYLLLSYTWSSLAYSALMRYFSIRTTLVLIYLAFVIYVFLMGLNFNDLRYKTDGIRDSGGGILTLYVFTKLLITFDMILIFCMCRGRQRIFLSQKWVNVSMVCLYFSMLGGTADILLGLAVFGVLFMRRFTTWIFFNSGLKISSELIKFSFVSLMFLPALFLMLLLGESIKSQFSLLEVDITSFMQSYGSLDVFGYYFIESFSSPLHSLNYALDREGLFPRDNNLLIIYQVYQDRFVAILNMLGADIDRVKPAVVSFSQFNYFELTKNYHDLRQGTSPGVFASFIYLVGVPLGFIFSVLYLVFIARIIDWLLMLYLDNMKFSIFGVLVVLYIFIGFFQSPVDLANILDNLSIMVLLLLLTASFSKFFLRKQTVRSSSDSV